MSDLEKNSPIADMRRIRISPAGALLRLAWIFRNTSGSSVIRARDPYRQIQISEEQWVSVVGLVERSFDRQFKVIRNSGSYQKRNVSNIKNTSIVPRIQFGEHVHHVLDPQTKFGRECIRAASMAQYTATIETKTIDVTNLYGPRLDIATALARLWVSTTRIEYLERMRWGESEDGQQQLQQTQIVFSRALEHALTAALMAQSSNIAESYEQEIEELKYKIQVTCRNFHALTSNPKTMTMAFEDSQDLAERVTPESNAMLDALGMQIVILEAQLDELRHYTTDLNQESLMRDIIPTDNQEPNNERLPKF